MIKAEAQALIDSFAAAGLVAYLLATLVRRPDGPLTPRLIFLFGVMAVFYGLRSTLGWTGIQVLEGLTFAAISLAPLAALLLAEGLLRRHAPRAMKVTIGLVCVVSVAFALFTQGHLILGHRLGLALPVILSLLAVLVLLATRDRTSLSVSENSAIRSVAIGLAGAIPLIVTDFPELAPVPVGLSPVAVLLVVRLTSSSNASEARDQWIEMGLIALAAIALTFGLSRAFPVATSQEGFRLAAVIFTGLITTSLLVRIQPFGSTARRNDLRLRLGSADTRSLDAFLRDMGDQPMLRDMTVLDENDLADHRTPAMAALLAERPVWSAASLRAGASGGGDATCEAVLDLLDRAGGTHIGLLSLSPLRIGLVALPGLLHNTEVESDLTLVFKTARLTAAAAR